MENHKAIPPGYMTVGEVARRMGVTVRTLQYYDREGLLSPSAESEGGRRLYADQDIVKLHQILSLKHLGFSLDDIKNRLVALDSPAAVAEVLAGQEAAIQERLTALAESLREIRLLREEVLQMQTVDFKKYADIVVNLQMNNEFYWLIKHFDDRTLDHIRSRFDRKSGLAFLERFKGLCGEARRLGEAGVPPESDEAQSLAAVFWGLVTEFTGGDMSLLPKLMEIGRFDHADSAWKEAQAAANAYLEPALDIYFTRLGVQPFAPAEGEGTP